MTGSTRLKVIIGAVRCDCGAQLHVRAIGKARNSANPLSHKCAILRIIIQFLKPSFQVSLPLFSIVILSSPTTYFSTFKQNLPLSEYFNLQFIFIKYNVSLQLLEIIEHMALLATLPVTMVTQVKSITSPTTIVIFGLVQLVCAIPYILYELDRLFVHVIEVTNLD